VVNARSPVLSFAASAMLQTLSMKKHEETSRQGCGRLGEDESKAGERRPTG